MTYHIYCDESRQTKDRYMVLGGIIISADNEKRFNEAMQLYRRSNGMFAELKWVKVSNQKFKNYCALVDLFFSVSNIMHFKSIVVDTHEIDYGKYHKGDRELGFYKFFYQLLLHGFGPYMKGQDKYIVFLHRRQTKYKLGALYVILNRGLKKKFAEIERDLVRSIHPIDSKKSNVLQLVDVLIGAIGYQMNGAHLRTEARKAKVLLSEYIAKKAGLESLIQETPRRKKEFSIWHFKLQN